MVDSNMDFIKEDLQEKLRINFPNVLLNSIEVLQIPNNNLIKVEISYGVLNTDIKDQLELNFS